MKRFEIVEEVGKGCALSMVAAVLSMGVAVSTLQFNPSKEIQEACHRVVPTALAITAIGGLGVLWSDYTFSQMAKKAVERIEKARWESLKKELKGTEYCVTSCKNCKQLVGRVSVKSHLICGMHPYGWQGKGCPDWESKND